MYTPSLIDEQLDGTIRYTFKLDDTKNVNLFLISETSHVIAVFSRNVGEEENEITDYVVEHSPEKRIKCVVINCKINFDLIYIIAEERV
jgi:hypothetical protein